jgi:hypothetical protein
MGRKVLWSVVLVLSVVITAILHCGHEPEYGGYWLVPVRVHLLRSQTLEAANCQLSQQDVQRIFSRVNQIWAPSKISFEIESVLEEEARDASPALLEGDRISLAYVQRLRPVASLTSDLIHVYYIHRMTSNGVFQGLDALFVQDTAQLEAVPGGIETPLPRVTAHELGHALGLLHRQAVTNLMASGTAGLTLNASEISTARVTVAIFPFARKSPVR